MKLIMESKNSCVNINLTPTKLSRRQNLAPKAASPKVEDGLHFWDYEYDSWIWTATVIIYELGSDRTLRSRDRIVEFSQEIVKICAAARNLNTLVIFDRSGRYNQPVQYGRDAVHKSRAAWAVWSLGVYVSERQHIYEDLNESSSARPGGSQQLGIPPSPNSKRTPNFSADILARRGNFS